MIKKIFIVSSFLFAAQVLYSQAQFAGFYVGEVFLRTITSGIESDEIKQGDANLTIVPRATWFSGGGVSNRTGRCSGQTLIYRLAADQSVGPSEINPVYSIFDKA